ncbi:hypothetical protein [Streptomyces nanshensis]|uniref:Uncharacterized protein n=1 Tax=Streptomyces nanshensis TaxID=518642 RepID=A0A1E7KZS0_9ACTN|nr:hypothetical protein [Streptomyces nanshensis]OEV09303.1 hypothetical protein AN218_22990 [Streptomyces nanshensis]
MIPTNTVLAAPSSGGASLTQGLGAVGLSSLAAAGFIVLIIAIRNRSKLTRKYVEDRRYLAGLAAVIGVLFTIAGGTWRMIAQGTHDLATSTLTDPNIVAGVSPAGIALILTTLAFLPEWQKRLPPAFFGLGAGVSWGVAGAFWGILFKVIGAMLEKLA